MSDSITVLYVEDDTMSQTIFQLLLQEMGITEVTIWSDSNNFLERLKTLNPNPDIIFLDIHVDPYSGFDMLNILRGIEKFRKTTIVALTASVMNEEVNRLKNAGFDSCLAKPINADTFASLFYKILEGETIWRITY